MTDTVDQRTRSRMMSGIRGKDTRPELLLRKALHRQGLRFRLHRKDLPGRPDIVFPRFRSVCFVHGCFWHRHENCRYTTTPATRTEFWTRKFEQNVVRDSRSADELLAAGWRVATVWECALRHEPADAIAARVRAWLEGDLPTLVIPDEPERT
ncbi:MAG: very short patch repair endonuclease [Gammaproteobacteria bacterium]|nr:MAG: very short patch repair endonuclease [Gammaproteobacteria bacterium]